MWPAIPVTPQDARFQETNREKLTLKISHLEGDEYNRFKIIKLIVFYYQSTQFS